ncbi:hypothetical protein FRC16_007728 [Serendipita sp. 398]|nr:hypothetical protein FRC16_007728 [Serendipita sp. 398]
MDDARRTLNEVMRGVDRTLFEDYIKPKAGVLTGLMRKGVIDPKIDWFDMPRPTEVRDYIYEILMYLVGVHAEVSAIAKSLLERTLTTLIIETVNEALECFKQIKKFGMGGMLRVSEDSPFDGHLLTVSLRPRSKLNLCTKLSFNTLTNRRTGR